MSQKQKWMLKDNVRLMPYGADQRWHPADRVDAPQIYVQVDDIAEIKDQIPDMMVSTEDGEVSFNLTSISNKHIESCAGYPGYWEGYYL